MFGGRGFMDDDDAEATFGLGFTPRFGGLSGYDLEDDAVDTNTSVYSAYGESDVIIEEPLFSKRRFGFKPPASTSIKQVICAGGYAFIVLSNARIIRRALRGSDPDVEVHPLPKKREGQCKVERVFIDPSASHMITCAISQDGHESFYVHLASQKPTSFTLNAIKRHKITAVAWNPLAQPSVPSTQPILLGTAQGCVFEMDITHNDHRAHQIFTVADAPGGITGIHLDVQKSSKLGIRFYIILACPHRFLQYMGPPGPEGQRFESILKRHELRSGGQEAPPLPRSKLAIFQRFPSSAEAMAWMTPLGAYFGHFDFANALRDESTAIPSFNVVPYNPGTEKIGEEADIPVSLVLTEFHLLLLYPNSIRAICTINNKQVLEERMPNAAGRFVGIDRDPVTETIVCYSDKFIYRVDATNETRDLWRLMMDKGNFEEALTYCATEEDKNEVHAAQATYLFDNQEFERAASAFSKTDVPFETIALKFLDKQEEGPLRVFLGEKLRRLSAADVTQRALLTTWLVELFLNALDAAESDGKDKYGSTMEEFKQFLQDDATLNVLHKETVFDLISSHGNVDVLLFFAELHKQFDVVVQHHIQAGHPDDAIAVLSKEGEERPQLIYQFAAELIQTRPHDLISLCRSVSSVDARQLIPAFVRHQQKHFAKSEAIDHIISYLKWVIETRGTKDTAIHNYLISLYVSLEDQQPLLDFIREEIEGMVNPRFDPKYALRLCLENNRKEACVALYSHMHLYEEAVETALGINLEMAIDQVTRAKGDIEFIDQAREKQLWLRIANHVIKVKNDIPRAMDLLKHSVLKIEDILPLFDDFKIIDPFQRNIQRSLESYNKEIQQLRESMEQSTTSARAIRADILQLNKRMERVSGDMMCDVCEYPLLTRAFYLFPCHHAFHKDCLVREVVKYLSPAQCRRINSIKQKLRDLPATPDAINQVISLNSQMDEIVGQDCVVCGELAIEMIEKPFIPKDQLEDYIDSWSTGGVDLGHVANEEDEEFGLGEQRPIMDSFA